MVRGVLVYGAASLLGLTLCIAETLKYAHQLDQAAAVLQTTDSASDASSSSAVPLPVSPFESVSSVLSSLPFLLSILSSSASLPGLRRFLAFFLRSKVNEVMALNLVVSMLAGAVRAVQLRLFGPLSDNEAKACRENLFNFLVFRSVFVAAIVPLDVRELMVWCAFFAVIAALRLLCIIARERFATVTILPSATADTFVRVIVLIAALLLTDLLLAAAVWAVVRRQAGLSVVCLLLFENVVVLLGCLKVSGKYLIHLLGLRRGQGWEERNSYLYYCEFVFEVLTQLLTLLHYLHVWSFYGLSVTIIDLFLFLHLRSSFIVLVDRISKYHHYRRASVEINSRYADATQAELEQADDFCAICREGMDSAKKLPCGHLSAAPADTQQQQASPHLLLPLTVCCGLCLVRLCRCSASIAAASLSGWSTRASVHPVEHRCCTQRQRERRRRRSSGSNSSSSSSGWQRCTLRKQRRITQLSSRCLQQTLALVQPPLLSALPLLLLLLRLTTTTSRRRWLSSVSCRLKTRRSSACWDSAC